MAKQKVYGFNEQGFNRVVEATRRVLRSPTTGTARRRRQPPVLTGGAAGVEVVTFSIVSYDYATGIAVCTVEWASKNGAVSGEDDDSTIEVVDPKGCNFNESAADLIGRWGDAAYLWPRSGDGQPAWVCLGLCCPDS